MFVGVVTSEDLSASGCGVCIKDADTGETLKRVCRNVGKVSLERAEREGVLIGLEESMRLDPDSIMVILSNSGLVRVLTEDGSNRLHSIENGILEILRMESRFGKPVRYRYEPCERNDEAGELARRAIEENCA